MYKKEGVNTFFGANSYIIPIIFDYLDKNLFIFAFFGTIFVLLFVDAKASKF